MPVPTRSDYIERDAPLPRFAGGAGNPDLPEQDGPVYRTYVVRGTFWAEITAWESLEDAKHDWPAYKIENQIRDRLTVSGARLSYDFDDVQLDLKWMTQDESDALDCNSHIFVSVDNGLVSCSRCGAIGEAKDA